MLKMVKPKRLPVSKCVKHSGTDKQELVPQEKRRIQTVLDHLIGQREYLVNRRVINTRHPVVGFEDRTFTVQATTMCEALGIADEAKFDIEHGLGHHHGSPKMFDNAKPKR